MGGNTHHDYMLLPPKYKTSYVNQQETDIITEDQMT